MSYGRAVDKSKIGINREQTALIHVAKKQLGLDDEDYRSILLLYAGVESSKYIKLDGFERVMEHFKRLGFENTTAKAKQPTHAPRRDPDGPPYMAQLKMIEHYFQQLGIDDAKRRQGLSQRIIKKPWPQTRSEANKIFEALKAMLARNYKAE